MKYNELIKIKGVDSEYAGMPFGRQIDSIRAIREFIKDAKVVYVGCKGRATLSSVKREIKIGKYTEYYAKWQADSEFYKDDVVNLYINKDYSFGN